jgi:hypothetical protein
MNSKKIDFHLLSEFKENFILNKKKGTMKYLGSNKGEGIKVAAIEIKNKIFLRML